VYLISISNLKIKMKKITVLVLAVVLLVSSVVYYKKPVQAVTHNITIKSKGAGCSDGATFTPSNSISVNAGDSITFTVPQDDPYAGGVEIHNFPGGDFTVARGSSQPTPALLVDVPNYIVTWPSSGCTKGNGVITVIQPQTPVAVPVAPPPPPPPVVPAALPPPPPNKPPEVLKLDQVKVESDKIDITKSVSIDRSKPITISGYTIANGVINLTIHSTVRTEMARANSEGFWSFTIENLEPGDHTVEASVTDLSTRLTSENTTLFKFAVTGDETAAEGAQNSSVAANIAKKSTKNLTPLIAGAVFLALLVTAGGFWFKKKHNNKKPKDPKTPAPPPVQIQPSI
jgi:hypothetical protein